MKQLNLPKYTDEEMAPYVKKAEPVSKDKEAIIIKIINELIEKKGKIRGKNGFITNTRIQGLST